MTGTLCFDMIITVFEDIKLLIFIILFGSVITPCIKIYSTLVF